jgi:hypothetical protein
MGWEDKIELVTQPANSPDTNVNDLAFFNSLQADYYDHAPTYSFELIEFVKKAHTDSPISKLKQIWLTYQSYLNKIINHHGSNFYKIPQMGKAKMEREGTLPRVLDVTENAKALLVGGGVAIAPELLEEDNNIIEEWEFKIEGDGILRVYFETWAWPLSVILSVLTTFFETSWLSAVWGCSVSAAIALFWLIYFQQSYGHHLFCRNETNVEILTLVSTWINTRNFLNICFDLEICLSK